MEAKSQNRVTEIYTVLLRLKIRRTVSLRISRTSSYCNRHLKFGRELALVSRM